MCNIYTEYLLIVSTCNLIHETIIPVKTISDKTIASKIKVSYYN